MDWSFDEIRSAIAYFNKFPPVKSVIRMKEGIISSVNAIGA